MKKYIIGIVLLLLGITGYITYDYMQVDALQNELLDQTTMSNLKLIEENQQDYNKYELVGLGKKGLKKKYDSKFIDGSWSLVTQLNKSMEYQMLFDDLPMMKKDGVELGLHEYFQDYLSDDLYASQIIEANEIKELSEQVAMVDPEVILQDYYELAMSHYLDGKLNSSQAVKFHRSIDEFAQQLDTTPTELFAEVMPNILTQYQTYSDFKGAKDNLRSLSEKLESTSLNELYEASNTILGLMEAPEESDYEIKGLEFTSSPDANTFVFQKDFIQSIRDKKLKDTMAIKELTDRLSKDNIVRNKTLKSNEIYYIVSTNDFLEIMQVEIIYIFDKDFSQFVHTIDSKKVI